MNISSSSSKNVDQSSYLSIKCLTFTLSSVLVLLSHRKTHSSHPPRYLAQNKTLLLVSASCNSITTQLEVVRLQVAYSIILIAAGSSILIAGLLSAFFFFYLYLSGTLSPYLSTRINTFFLKVLIVLLRKLCNLLVNALSCKLPYSIGDSSPYHHLKPRFSVTLRNDCGYFHVSWPSPPNK